MRLKILFWNINKNAIPGFVGHLVREADANLLILAECRIPNAELLVALNAERSDWQYAWGNCGRLAFFVRQPTLSQEKSDGGAAMELTPLIESRRVSIRRLRVEGHEPLLIAAAHLPAKLGYSDDSQVLESAHLARLIADAEAAEGHQRTLLVGDLNMNPFEPGMVGARGGLNGVMSRHIARRGSRTVQREKYPFFYNPMWNHLGDRAETGGTFYYENSEPVCYFWNMFDQVLLRPDLLNDFEPEHVRILRQVRGMSLLQQGRPDKEMTSDHLPIALELKLEGRKNV